MIIMTIAVVSECIVWLLQAKKESEASDKLSVALLFVGVDSAKNLPVCSFWDSFCSFFLSHRYCCIYFANNFTKMTVIVISQ